MGIVVAVLLQVAVAFTTLARGTDSQVSTPREVVVRSADEWQALWKDHSAAPVPVVDFSRFMVVGIFLGTRPTAGYATDVVRVRSEGTVTIVEYREQQPARGAITAQVLTAPFHLVRIPRVAGTIEFKKLAS
jgi:hypothetical protein